MLTRAPIVLGIRLRRSSLSGLPLLALPFLLLALVPGCGTPACKGAGCVPTPDAGNPGGLTITPMNQTLTVDNDNVTQQFKAMMGGEDVTAKATWKSLDTSFASINKAGLMLANFPLVRGGNVTISATYMGSTAMSTLNLFYVPTPVIAMGAADSAPTSFGGAASSDVSEIPHVTYPLDGSMNPSNLGTIDIQWTGSQKDTLFRIHFVGVSIDAAFYVGMGACTLNMDTMALACHFQPTADQWSVIARSAAGDQVSMQVSGTKGNGASVAGSATKVYYFSPDSVKGAFYYFTPALNGIMRVPFGGAKSTVFLDGMNGDYACIGCHTLSRDGTKLAATFWDYDGTGGISNGSDGKTFPLPPQMNDDKATKRWNFATFSPDNSKLLTSYQGVLTLRDGTTGVKLADLPKATVGGGLATMPEWSPDGKSVAFVQLGKDGQIGMDLSNMFLTAGDWIIGNAGHIATMSYDSTTGFGASLLLVAATKGTEFHYYPTWSPDSQWLVFISATLTGGMSPTADHALGGKGPDQSVEVLSYGWDSTRLRLVSSTPGSRPIDLLNAGHLPKASVSWPKFAPFAQNSGNLAFFTFSALIPYGNTPQDKPVTQLWMSAVDFGKAKLADGGDPSYAPVWMPFQSVVDANQMGNWASVAVCKKDSDCGVGNGFTCQMNACALPQ